LVPSALAGAAVDSDDRVRVESLEAHTTYYYKVDSEAADGTSDGRTVKGSLPPSRLPQIAKIDLSRSSSSIAVGSKSSSRADLSIVGPSAFINAHIR
jgi:hypothetical protein